MKAEKRPPNSKMPILWYLTYTTEAGSRLCVLAESRWHALRLESNIKCMLANKGRDERRADISVGWVWQQDFNKLGTRATIGNVIIIKESEVAA